MSSTLNCKGRIVACVITLSRGDDHDLGGDMDGGDGNAEFVSKNEVLGSNSNIAPKQTESIEPSSTGNTGYSTQAEIAIGDAPFSVWTPTEKELIIFTHYLHCIARNFLLPCIGSYILFSTRRYCSISECVIQFGQHNYYNLLGKSLIPTPHPLRRESIY